MEGLQKHLIAKTEPIANKENIVYWHDYRISVLQERLFRVEKGIATFCDSWYL